jgi:hypothetical protein
MSGFWYVAVALTAVGAGVVAWCAAELRQRHDELAATTDRQRELRRQAAALGVDVRRLRARLATVEVVADARRRRVDG